MCKVCQAFDAVIREHRYLDMFDGPFPDDSKLQQAEDELRAALWVSWFNHYAVGFLSGMALCGGAWLAGSF
jgi:hypothetical protein